MGPTTFPAEVELGVARDVDLERMIKDDSFSAIYSFASQVVTAFWGVSRRPDHSIFHEPRPLHAQPDGRCLMCFTVYVVPVPRTLEFSRVITRGLGFFLF